MQFGANGRTIENCKNIMNYCYRNVSFALFNEWNVSKTSFDHEKAGMEGSCLCIHYSLSLKLFSFFLSLQFTFTSPLLFSYRQLYFSTLWILRSICKYFYLSFVRSFYLSPANHPSIPPLSLFFDRKTTIFHCPVPWAHRREYQRKVYRLCRICTAHFRGEGGRFM